MVHTRAADELRKLLGSELVSEAEQDLVSYSADMLAKGQILKLGKEVMPVRPLAVCFPETVEDVRRVLALCHQERIPVIPYGAGSGVCGATVPEEPAVILDTKRMCGILSFSPKERTVTVEPGVIGERLEEYLGARGFTTGHFPSSIFCSTVGGYVACRSAGQFSSRYGKIEDMTLGLEAVAPGGRTFRLGTLGNGNRRDPMVATILGSEGTLVVITKICLRVQPVPSHMDFRGLAFPGMEEAVQCMRRIMQTPLRPTVMRMYDPLDSLIAGHHTTTAAGKDINRAVAELSGLKALLGSAVLDLNHAGLAALLYKPGLLNRVAEILPSRPILVIGVQGSRTAVSRQWDKILEVGVRSHGEDLGPEPGWAWYNRRYSVSHKQTKVYAAGAFVDTMEVATTWDHVLPLYKAVLKAMGPLVFVMAHFSHAYPEGCSIYFTFAGYRPSMQSSLKLHHQAWKAGLNAVSRMPATISHHHGIGLVKRAWLDRESPGGGEIFNAFKKVLDPGNIMNPGKLYKLDTAQGRSGHGG